VGKTSELRRYADLKGVDVRTVRGWCRSKKIPAKKWKRDGRWHLHPLLIAREESLRYFRRYFGDGNGKHSLTARDKRALEYTLVKTGLRDPEERRKYISYRFCDDPEERKKFQAAYAEISQPYEDIMAAADWLEMKSGKIPTAKEVAKHLKMSVAQLYSIHPGIMRVIKARYREDSPTETDFDWDRVAL
jgi:hypothetical protein